MQLSEEMNRRIEEQMAALTRDALLRPGMSYNDFTREYSELLAQAEEDEVPLRAAGFDFSTMDLYAGYLEKLVLEHGERVNAEAETGEARETFAEGMPRAREDKALLMAVGRYVEARTEGPEAKRVLDRVRKRRGDVDTLNDNIALVGFARRFKTLVLEVRPGGQVIDDALLTRIENDARRLLRVRGQAVAAADDTSLQVDRQNRLITLCVEAKREIKLFAEMAFYNDADRYNRCYASDAGRRPAATTEEPAETAEEAAREKR